MDASMPSCVYGYMEHYANRHFRHCQLDIALIFLFFDFLLISYLKYQFSDLSYLLFTIYLALHLYGSKYTYAENPFGYWLKDAMGWERNHYDRIVHFAFGFLLAYPMRELFISWYKFPGLGRIGFAYRNYTFCKRIIRAH